MLHLCKVNKFKEVNFKIFHQILAISTLLAKVKKALELCRCVFCGTQADLGHILSRCPATQQLHSWVCGALDIELETFHWILGYSKAINPVIWLTNFALYKMHILAVEGHAVVLRDIAQAVYKSYHYLFLTSHVTDLL